MALPYTALQVAEATYSVELDDRDALPDGRAFDGWCLPSEKRIAIHPHLLEERRSSAARLRHVYLHEVLHALGAEREIGYWAQHTARGDVVRLEDGNVATLQEPDQIDKMTSALLEWMRANPDVVRWMIGDSS